MLTTDSAHFKTSAVRLTTHASNTTGFSGLHPPADPSRSCCCCRRRSETVWYRLRPNPLL